MIDNDEVAADLLAFMDRQGAFVAMLAAWASGTPAGGPNGDGKYPLPSGVGSTVLIDCPAQINAFKIAALTGSNSLALTAAHNGYVINVFNADAQITVTVPAGLPTGWHCIVNQFGPGQLRFLGATGVSLTNSQGYIRSRKQKSLVTLFRDGTNSVIMQADMVA